MTTPPPTAGDILTRVNELQNQLRNMQGELTAIASDLVLLGVSQVKVTVPPQPSAATAPPALTKQRELPVPKGSNLGPTYRSPTMRQANYIRSLCDKKFARVTGEIGTLSEASQLIGSLKGMNDVALADRDMTSEVKPLATFRDLPDAVDPSDTSSGDEEPSEVESEPVQDYLPFNSLALIPAGRYAVTSDDGKQTVFLRKVRRPAKRYHLEKTLIQYKSSDSWITAQTYVHDSTPRVFGRTHVHGSSIADLLTQVMLDRGGCAVRYGERFGECSNCGRELTDDKSRYYTLGTECIQHRHDIVEWVNKTKGDYVAGAASVD